MYRQSLMNFRIFISISSIIQCQMAYGTELDSEELRILPDNPSFTKPVGSSILFTCSLTSVALAQVSGPPPNLLWIDSMDRDVLDSTGRIYVELDGGAKKLYITSIEERDAGKFTCQTNLNGRLLRRSVSLDLYKPITFVKFPMVLAPAIHTDARIECIVTGSPAPNVTWKYQGQRILLSDDKYVRDAVSLTVRNVTTHDEGNYTCRAEVESEGRYDERTVQLDVHIPPRLTSSALQQEGVAGEELSLYCEATGHPKPTYQFYKDNSAVPLRSSKTVEVDSVGGTVQFKPVLESDEGLYRCVVSNDVGSVVSTGRVVVLVPPSIDHIVNGVADEGGDLYIECQSTGKPAPTISFSRRGQDEQLDANSRATFSIPGPGRARLILKDVIASDAGNYTCTSRNTLGSVQRDATVTVQYAPRFSTNEVSRAYTWVGQTRNLTCEWNAEPMGTVQWYKRGLVITENSTYQVINIPGASVLQVTVRVADQARIYDNYACTVTNRLGSATKGIELRRATAPDAPEDVKVMEIMPTEVKLEMTPPKEDGGMQVVGYRVEYDGQVQELSLESDQMIRNLKPSTMYILKVSARNEVGVGKPRQETIKTKDTSVPYPVIITSPHLSPHAYEFTLKWNAPNSGGLPISHYKFKYRLVDASVDEKSFNLTQPLDEWQSFDEPEKHDYPIVSYTFTGLKPGSTYQAEVLAHNQLGWSTPGPLFVFSTAPGKLLSTWSFGSSHEGEREGNISRYNHGGDFSKGGGRSYGNTSDSNPSVELEIERERSGESKLEEQRRQEAASMSGVGITLIVLAVIILFAVLVDVGCYYVNSCGITACLCIRLCPGANGRQRHSNGSGAKIKHVEDGENEKRPLSEFGGSDNGDSTKTYKSGGISEPVWSEQKPAGASEC